MIIHVTADWQRPAADQRRHRDASAGWARAFRGADYLHVPVHEASLRRNAKTVLGDNKTIPFLRDIIDAGVDRSAAKPSDVIVYTNDDIGLREEMSDLVSVCHPCYASRRDFITLPRRLTKHAISQGHLHSGADLFAFPVGMWPEIRQKLPDFLIAREGFDLVLRDILRGMGGVEIFNVLAHALHIQDWTKCHDHPSSVHNRKLADAYIKAKGISELKYL